MSNPQNLSSGRLPLAHPSDQAPQRGTCLVAEAEGSSLQPGQQRQHRTEQTTITVYHYGTMVCHTFGNKSASCQSTCHTLSSTSWLLSDSLSMMDSICCIHHVEYSVGQHTSTRQFSPSEHSRSRHVLHTIQSRMESHPNQDNQLTGGH